MDERQLPPEDRSLHILLLLPEYRDCSAAWSSRHHLASNRKCVLQDTEVSTVFHIDGNLVLILYVEYSSRGVADIWDLKASPGILTSFEAVAEPGVL